jgi:hypothetical protein
VGAPLVDVAAPRREVAARQHDVDQGEGLDRPLVVARHVAEVAARDGDLAAQEALVVALDRVDLVGCEDAGEVDVAVALELRAVRFRDHVAVAVAMGAVGHGGRP